MTLLAVDRSHVESEVARRLAQHAHGQPGFSIERPTGDGTSEMVCRDAKGVPVGVMGFNRAQVVDFAVAKPWRRLGIATRMYQHLGRIGIVHIRGPFTEDGAAFVRSLGAL